MMLKICLSWRILLTLTQLGRNLCNFIPLVCHAFPGSENLNGRLGHTASTSGGGCFALQPTVQPNQITERLVRHLMPYVNQSDCRHRPAHVISVRKLRYGYGIVFCY